MTTTKSPAFQFYYKEWLTSTRGWTHTERDIYFHLLMYQFDLGTLPNDMRELERMTECNTKPCKDALRWVLNKKFVLTDAGYINNKMASIQKEQEEYKASKSKAGKSGMAKRYQQANTPITESQQNSNSVSDVLLTKSNPTSTTTTTSTSDISDVDDDDGTKKDFKNWFQHLRDDVQDVMRIAGAQHCTGEDVYEALTEFENKKTATGENARWLSATDMRKHFLNWLPSFINRKNKTQHDTRHSNKPEHKHPAPREPRINRVTKSQYEASNAELEKYFAERTTD